MNLWLRYIWVTDSFTTMCDIYLSHKFIQKICVNVRISMCEYQINVWMSFTNSFKRYVWISKDMWPDSFMWLIRIYVTWLIHVTYSYICDLTHSRDSFVCMWPDSFIYLCDWALAYTLLAHMTWLMAHMTFIRIYMTYSYIYDMTHGTYDMTHGTYDMTHGTYDMSHGTYDMTHVLHTYDMSHVIWVILKWVNVVAARCNTHSATELSHHTWHIWHDSSMCVRHDPHMIWRLCLWSGYDE